MVSRHDSHVRIKTLMHDEYLNIAFMYDVIVFDHGDIVSICSKNKVTPIDEMSDIINVYHVENKENLAKKIKTLLEDAYGWAHIG